MALGRNVLSCMAAPCQGDVISMVLHQLNLLTEDISMRMFAADLASAFKAWMLC